MATLQLREQLGRQRQREASRVAEDRAVKKCKAGGGFLVGLVAQVAGGWMAQPWAVA